MKKIQLIQSISRSRCIIHAGLVKEGQVITKIQDLQQKLKPGLDADARGVAQVPSDFAR